MNDPRIVDLGGDGWTLARDADASERPAVVPGCVHDDLRRNGEVGDYFWRDAEATMRWVDREAWTYRRAFDLDAVPDEAELVCEGLDTLARVAVNGRVVIEADNMYRTWRADVKAALRAGTNEISVRFVPPYERMAEGEAKRHLEQWNTFGREFAGRGHVRKMACAFGWDWAPAVPTMGIWRPIRLRLGPRPVEDVRVTQEHGGGGVTVRVAWQPAHAAAVTLAIDGEAVAAAEGEGAAALRVDRPRLWWPNGLGDQPLYDLTITPRVGPPVSRRIGLRTIALRREPDEWGQSFEFVVNGRPVYAKGANWVPGRVLPTTIDEGEVRRVLGDAAMSHFNMLRVWGGGLYESDAFYDGCDELGLLVWQDFAFACGAYPSDDEFLANVEAEAVDNVRRLRHRASLALWCGNNEIEQGFAGRDGYPWEDYDKLFNGVLPRVVADEDGTTPYIPSSGHTPPEFGDRADHANQDAGDAHMWTVWFGGKPFEAQRAWTCRFMSEYGFQSYPGRRTFDSFTAPGDRNLTSRIADYHQRSQMGNRTIAGYLLDWFQMPPTLDGQLAVSQISQALCVRYAAEHLRRLRPRNAGVLYWQLNDVWPCASWSSVDCFGRWKALQHEARRFFEPVHLSAEKDLATETVKLHVANDGPETVDLPVRWEVTDTDSAALLSGEARATLPRDGGGFVATIDCRPLLGERFAGDLMVWAWLGEAGAVVSRAWTGVARPKHLSLADPGLRATPGEDAAGAYLDLACDRPALWVDPGDDVLYDDGFLHLHPREPRRLRLLRGGHATRVTSLADHMLVRPSGESIPSKPPAYVSPIGR